MSDDTTTTKPRTSTKPKVEKPKLYKVILLNDDFTPREFVVRVLKAEFRVTDDQAYRIMITAHRQGSCVVAVFTRDVAETWSISGFAVSQSAASRCRSNSLCDRSVTRSIPEMLLAARATDAGKAAGFPLTFAAEPEA